MIQHKVDFLDECFKSYSIGSFAELGCAWGVDGGYGFHILDHYEIGNAVQVDRQLSEKMQMRAVQFPHLRLFQRDFGDPSLPAEVGDVDAIILFDVLLHQVKPDWDQILQMWAPRTKYFVIYNQQWIKSSSTVRLIELGREEYFQSVPAGSENFTSYIGLFDRLDEKLPDDPARTRRDNKSIWQWAITDPDLIKVCALLDFELERYGNCGPAFGIKNFENHAFLFSKRD